MNDQYLTTAEIAVVIRVDHTKYPRIAVHKFLKRNKVPTVGNGRVKALRSSVLEALQSEGKRRRQRTADRRRARLEVAS